jgi:hypothetical protein
MRVRQGVVTGIAPARFGSARSRFDHDLAEAPGGIQVVE